MQQNFEVKSECAYDYDLHKNSNYTLNAYTDSGISYKQSNFNTAHFIY